MRVTYGMAMPPVISGRSSVVNSGMLLLMTYERALLRYADRVYRLALIRDGDPRRAADATVRAWQALDWINPPPDDQLEQRLIAALPAPRRPSLWKRRRAKPRGLPNAFWTLDPAVRLALALRWTRGYDAPAIAAVLGRSVDETYALLEGALDMLAPGAPLGDDPACRTCRRAQLDGLAPARGHLLGCAACRDVLGRWERAEHDFAQGAARLANAATLPDAGRATLQAFGARLGGTQQRVARGPAWRDPSAWRIVAVVAAVMVVAAGVIVAPRPAADTARPPADPRALLRLALDRYGAVPDGEGVIHQRFAVQLGEGGETLQADVWTDAAEPARHRMQLTDGERVREWQLGDGEDTLRYSGSSNIWTCVPIDTGVRQALDVINRWPLAPAEQRTLREHRWQFGPWASGYRYLEAASAASVVRSLGVATEQGTTVMTLSAEGTGLRSSLMIELDARTGDLREVREIQNDNGSTRIFTPWRLLIHERMTEDEARQANVFRAYPLAQRPREIERTLPLIDTNCPTWQREYTFSLPSALNLHRSAVVGLDTPPSEIERIYLGGWRDSQGQLIPESLILVYAGAGHRLTMRTDDAGRNLAQLRTTPSITAIKTGDWRVWIRQRGLGWVAGFAEYIGPNTQRISRSVAFYAEGWSEDEAITILGGARPLTEGDWQTQRDLIFDPERTMAGGE
jgi:hypothetical protein